MIDSNSLYDAIAQEYDTGHWEVSHRKAYDLLSWEYVSALLPPAASIVDAGCGTGRWVEKLIASGHTVTGIEQSPGMIEKIESKNFNGSFSLRRGSMDEVELSAESFDAVIAMGSVQYVRDPHETIHRFVKWIKPGGFVAVLVDSFVSLLIELIGSGKMEETTLRHATRKGVWKHREHAAEYHLIDATTMEHYFTSAGLVRVRVSGLLCSFAIKGRTLFDKEFRSDVMKVLDIERVLAGYRELADLGKQLLTIGFKPDTEVVCTKRCCHE